MLVSIAKTKSTAFVSVFCKLKGMYFTLTGEMGKPEEADFERK